MGLILFVSIIFTGAVSAATIHVSPSDDAIQDAISSAIKMILYYFLSGTYNEHDIIVDKSITIKGPEIKSKDKPTAVIDANNNGRVFNIAEGVTVTLQNLIIQNGNTASRH